MKVLLTGASGQLGSEIQRAWFGLGRDPSDLISLDHREFDITKSLAIHRALSTHRPDTVINTAAFTKVDDCERFPLKALRANAGGVSLLARACAVAGAHLVQVSTDYVFDGCSADPYLEDAIPRPVNLYGTSKMMSENVVRQRLPDSHLIVRTSGLYGMPLGDRSTNFVSRVLEQARMGYEPRVVADQVCSPTFAADLASVLLRLLDSGARGTLHVTNQGECSWYEFARACLSYAGLSRAVIPISSDALLAPAKRPAYSVLANHRLAAFGVEQARSWRDALRAYIRAYQAGPN